MINKFKGTFMSFQEFKKIYQEVYRFGVIVKNIYIS